MSRQTKTGGREATSAVVPGRGVLSIGNPRTELPDGFAWTPLSDIARLESGHTPSRSNSAYWDGEIPWIGIRDATTNHGQRIDRTIQTITALGLENSSTRLLPAGTVCLSRTASVGYVLQIDTDMCTSQDFVNWVCGPQLIPDYLRYALVRESESIRQWAYGSTHRTLYFPEAKAIHIALPSLEAQHAITEVLGALDDKIAANRHLIEVIGQHCLATIARSLSVSATVENLGDICEFHNRKRVPLSKAERDSRIGDIPYYGATSRMGYVNESLFNQQLVLVGEDGSVVDEFGHPIVQYIWGPAWVNNHAHVLTGTVVSTEMLRWLLRRCNVESLITGAVQPKLSMGQLKSLRVDLPSGTELDRAEAVIFTLSARERAAAAEIECLARVRDELLPLLMNGRITVKGAERAAEDVL